MAKIIKSLTTLTILATIVSSATYAYFRDKETSSANAFYASVLDLKIKDGDENWGDGVIGTWQAENMTPGDEFDFSQPLVLLSKTYDSIDANHLEISCDYEVEEENPCLEQDTDCQTNLHPDNMAKEMLITRCVLGDGFCIDCLTGEKYTSYDTITRSCVGALQEQNDDWKISDVNGDGKISFYDLKNHKLDNLPPVLNSPISHFEMSVKFAESANNDFQGDIFNLTMAFTLNQDASQ